MNNSNGISRALSVLGVVLLMGASAAHAVIEDVAANARKRVVQLGAAPGKLTEISARVAGGVYERQADYYEDLGVLVLKRSAVDESTLDLLSGRAKALMIDRNNPKDVRSFGLQGWVATVNEGLARKAGGADGVSFGAAHFDKETGAAFADFRRELRRLLLDASEEVELRRRSLRQLASHGVAEDFSLLRRIAENTGREFSPALRKDALLMLSSRPGVESETIAIESLRAAEDAIVIDGARLALGRLDSHRSFTSLLDDVKSRGEPVSGSSAEVALLKHRGRMESYLKENDEAHVALALDAMKHIQWADEGRYKGELMALLGRIEPAKSPALFTGALDLLISAKLVQEDCARVMALIDWGAAPEDAGVVKSRGYLENCSRWAR